MQVSKETESPAALFRQVGSIASGVIGVALFGFGLFLFVATDTPGALGVMFAIGGFVEALMGYHALRGQRLSWSYLCAQNGMLSLAFLLAAPKIEGEGGVPMMVALLPCVVFGVVTVVLALAADEFR